jgi:hypothetical protein
VLHRLFAFLLLAACSSLSQDLPNNTSRDYTKHSVEFLTKATPSVAHDSAFLAKVNAASPAHVMGANITSSSFDQLPSEESAQGQSQDKVNPTSSSPAHTEGASEGKQSKRILWVIPNFRSVSADTQLPSLSFQGKVWLATQDSFDYSSFIIAGVVAGIGQAKNATPEFHQGGAGYGRYYWHAFADQALANYMTEAIVPFAARQDPRYYTLGHGGLFRRSGYAVTRLLVTKTDSGGKNFNFSEIVGNGAAAGISNLYYPTPERTWTKTGQKWLTQVSIDGLFNVCKEFWPDIDRTIFRGHY